MSITCVEILVLFIVIVYKYYFSIAVHLVMCNTPVKLLVYQNTPHMNQCIYCRCDYHNIYLLFFFIIFLKTFFFYAGWEVRSLNFSNNLSVLYHNIYLYLNLLSSLKWTCLNNQLYKVRCYSHFGPMVIWVGQIWYSIIFSQ